MNTSRYILWLTAAASLAGVAVLSRSRTGPDELLVSVSLAVIIVSLLPWIVFARRKLLRTRPPASRGWAIAIYTILLASVLIGPAVTGVGFLWLVIAKPTARGCSDPAIGVAVTSFLAFCTGIGLYTLAFVTQLWRDQWQSHLNALSIVWQIICFLLLYGPTPVWAASGRIALLCQLALHGCAGSGDTRVPSVDRGTDGQSGKATRGRQI